MLYFDRASLASPFSEPAAALAALGGSILLAGFWTPVIATLTGLCEIWLAVSVASSPFDRKFVHAILAVVAAAVAMLGPGAWSIDARLFGRRRFEIDRTRRRPNPSK